MTFYSYKGGTGRSMSLANVACLLARNSLGPVLVIDWDLEGPGLHRFFDPLDPRSGRRVELDKQFGVIDLMYAIREELLVHGLVGGITDLVSLSDYIVGTDATGVDLMTAGRFDHDYPSKVSSFDWQDMFESFPNLFKELSDVLSSRYNYVLIDSRTGLSDVSGICTALLPEVLVLVFTPNLQSLTGQESLLRRATKYRRESDDLRPLIAFPLPSRVELTVESLRDEWRFGKFHKDLERRKFDQFELEFGYQGLFESTFRDVYELTHCDLESYFDEVQIQHVPEYAYGESIAVNEERRGDRLSLTRSYENFVDRLVNDSAPWTRADAQKVSAGSIRSERIEVLKSRRRLLSRSLLLVEVCAATAVGLVGIFASVLLVQDRIEPAISVLVAFGAMTLGFVLGQGLIGFRRRRKRLIQIQREIEQESDA